MVPTALAAAAFLLAIAAFVKWRQAARRLERLAEHYWELRYEHGQIRSRLERLESAAPGGGPAGAGEAHPAAQAAGRPTNSFIPLSSLKR